ncbi:unnamed protein product [Prunus armeniaca]
MGSYSLYYREVKAEKRGHTQSISQPYLNLIKLVKQTKTTIVMQVAATYSYDKTSFKVRERKKKKKSKPLELKPNSNSNEKEYHSNSLKTSLSTYSNPHSRTDQNLISIINNSRVTWYQPTQI